MKNTTTATATATTTAARTTFFGNKVSAYGLEHGRVDYATLSKAFDAVLNNNIISNTSDIGYWEPVNGDLSYYEKEGEIITESEYEDLDCDAQDGWDYIENEIYQYYIISEYGYKILSDYTDEIVFYNEQLDMYVWGVTHYGTSWDYVLTDIKL